MRRQRVIEVVIAAFVLTTALGGWSIARADDGDGEVGQHEEPGDPGSPGDDEPNCRPACNDVRRVCKQAAKTTFKSCMEDCRGSLMPESCFAECKANHGDVKDGCKSDCHECKRTCPPPGDHSSDCEEACMADLRECAAGMNDAGKACARECADGAREAFGACFDSDDPIPCLLGVIRDLSGCLGECGNDLREGGEACKEAAEACRENCNQTGSASRAFLDPPASLLD
ncbi:MAG TPA: hypothetical protein VFD92_20800 [Candidatus Binatia bacterium]|nr:hypothetical protein [Candidatus Binatia bacterium]